MPLPRSERLLLAGAGIVDNRLAEVRSHPGEEIVLGDRAVDEASSEHVVVVRVHAGRDLVGQREPERRVRIDLRGVREQCFLAAPVVRADLDASS